MKRFDDVPDAKIARNDLRFFAASTTVVAGVAAAGGLFTFGAVTGAMAPSLMGLSWDTYTHYLRVGILEEKKALYIKQHGREAYKNDIAVQREKNKLLYSVFSEVKKKLKAEEPTRSIYNLITSNTTSVDYSPIYGAIVTADSRKEIDLLDVNQSQKRAQVLGHVVNKSRDAVKAKSIKEEIVSQIKEVFKSQGWPGGFVGKEISEQLNRIVQQLLEAGNFDIIRLKEEGKLEEFSQDLISVMRDESCKEVMRLNAYKDSTLLSFLVDNEKGFLEPAEVLSKLSLEWQSYRREPENLQDAIKSVQGGIAKMTKDQLKTAGKLSAGRNHHDLKQCVAVEGLLVPELLKQGNVDVIRLRDEGKMGEFAVALAGVISSEEGMKYVNGESKVRDMSVEAFMSQLAAEWQAYREEASQQLETLPKVDRSLTRSRKGPSNYVQAASTFETINPLQQRQQQI